MALRIAALEPDQYTHTGAALHHGSATLLREGASHKLLLLLTDGKPNDCDLCEGRYGIEDTGQAVTKAKLQGLSPFCLALDRQPPRRVRRPPPCPVVNASFSAGRFAQLDAAAGECLKLYRKHRMHTLKIYRCDPDVDTKPCMQTLELEGNPGDRMLLDALMRLKALDPSLSFRRSCREGICGSDAMNINGENGLACVTNMKSLQRLVTLKPLPGLPVICDLIVDMIDFFKQYHSIKPYLINLAAPAERERLHSTEQREELNGLYERILCACCSSACCRPTESLSTAVTRLLPNDWTISTILCACSAAAIF